MFQKLLIEVENYTIKCELFIINLYIYTYPFKDMSNY